MYTQRTDKGYLAAGGSTVWGPISLDGISTVTLSGNLISISGSGLDAVSSAQRVA